MENMLFTSLEKERALVVKAKKLFTESEVPAAALKSCGEELLENYEILVNQLADLNLSLQKQMNEINQLSKTDPQTRLSNRLDFLEKMTYETHRAERSKKPFAIVIADIDSLNDFSTRYNFECRDIVVLACTDIIKSQIRKQDLLARWSSDRFILLLPDTDTDGGRIAVEKIQKRLQETSVVYKNDFLTVTLSYGISMYRANLTVEDCILLADKAIANGKKPTATS